MNDQKSEIQYDDFAKLDIRIGIITAAEKVPETDKLLKCTVDFGALGIRTIVSGIASYRTPEQLIGKRVPYVVNLAPKIIRGVESQGMLMAVGDGDIFALMHPDADIPAGSRVR
ncbi:hypothetical protein EBR66_02110 [bacterium]|nr:hypothetical protein [bacterium]